MASPQAPNIKRSKTLYSDDDKKKGCMHGLDRISRLSDEIIVHILSYLDIKEAGRTSILSQRWRNVWTKLVDLSIVFDAPYYKSLDYQMRNNKFVEWVNQIVARHSTLLLDSFKLHFPFDINHSTHIDKWLQFAFQKAVQNLELNLSYPTNYIVPNYHYPIYFCDFMPFSDQLKSLILVGVDICGPALQDILCKCHNLEHLSVKNNKRLRTLEIVGSSSSSLKLKQLELFCCYNLGKLDIFANNLTSLLLWGEEISVEYHHVPSLVEAHFSGPYSSHLIHNFHHLSRFSSQLEKLSFSLEMIPPPIGFPIFTNVKTLELSVACHDGDSLLFLLSYLEACPLLHNFSLKISRSEKPSWPLSASIVEREEAISICRRNYEHKHKHLKVVEIVGFDGSIPDVQLVLHLVDSYALKLDKIIFDPRHPSCVGFVDPNEETFREPKSRAAQLIRRLPPTLVVIV